MPIETSKKPVRRNHPPRASAWNEHDDSQSDAVISWGKAARFHRSQRCTQCVQVATSHYCSWSDWIAPCSHPHPAEEICWREVKD